MAYIAAMAFVVIGFICTVVAGDAFKKKTNVSGFLMVGFALVSVGMALQVLKR